MRAVSNLRTAVAAVALCALAVPAVAKDPAPTVPGQCVATTITKLNHRFEDDPGSGSFVEYATGTIGVEYDEIPEVGRAKVGDKVELCLVSLPEDCPAGDERGKFYAAVDLRTQELWQMYDAEHLCGGA